MAEIRGRWRRWRRRPWRCSALLRFLFQINEIRTNSRAASARQAFLGYTDLAFKNPKFARSRTTTGSRASAATSRSSTRVLSRTSCTPARRRSVRSAEKREWTASCDDQLKPHLPFLCDKSTAQPAYLAT